MRRFVKWVTVKKYRRVSVQFNSARLSLSPAKPARASLTANLCKERSLSLESPEGSHLPPAPEKRQGSTLFGGSNFYGMVEDKHQMLMRTPTANPAAINDKNFFMTNLLKNSASVGCAKHFNSFRVYFFTL